MQINRTPGSPATGRRSLLLGSLGVLATPAIAQVAAFPNRPIRMVLPFPAGGSSDAHIRQMSAIVSRDLGQPVVVENRTGARGSLGAALIKGTPEPDAHTVSLMHFSILRHAHITQPRPWDPMADFTYICNFVSYTYGIAVRADRPWRTLQDFIAYAKANPGKVSYGTSAVAGTSHIMMEDLSSREGLEMIHVPFRGAVEPTLAVISGQLDAVADSTAWGPNVESGQMRALALATEARVERYSQVPTMKELGFPIVAHSPYGLFAKAGIPPEHLDVLVRAYRKAFESEASRDICRRFDLNAEYLGPTEYRAMIDQRNTYEVELIRRFNITA
ncbi:tripartite tricarboxylate transporter substrate binding protein [Neoroseomonas soli]|uniref:Tripartite tricarboxylate transporter substrate binding protein n=1 Tax=Neoroseomonas soli TaxID=1081025 RepID=A0A9X9WX76_9PROT|nr:tripartite tricarboxylate transporter substrate binding protein [Neoroseomonas soli]MBR0671755.1 tripartite tricarboxylate transporter substrate binding protein [Neoroseomonas soli]